MQRNQSLDALRGYAILTMVLSGSIAYGDALPAWMYHAQVPPPLHKFNDAIAGITWVDLVFPFFLFSMGAAIPLSLQKQVKEQNNFSTIFLIALRRFLLLAFFALFTEHMKAWVIASAPTTKEYLLSIAAFVLLFFQLYNNNNAAYKKYFVAAKAIAFILAIGLLFSLKFNGNSFSFTKSDIIIIVLANMAFFGTITWWLTKKNMWWRIGVLPFIMAVFFAAKETEGGWAKQLYNFSHISNMQFDWLYKFYFLKYLFIIIPGTIAGDWLVQYNNNSATPEMQQNKNASLVGMAALLIIITNTLFLFTRQLVLNLSITIALLTLLYYLLRQTKSNTLLQNFYTAGCYLLLLGLFFEAYEGGIKKDRSTYSYYFVCSGLAFFALISFSVIARYRFGNSIVTYLSNNGRNPMVAYVAGSLLLTPLLHITGAISLFEQLNANAWLGFLKGILFTGIVSAITILFTKRGWFWKT
jgi:predicted acyltransferase